MRHLERHLTENIALDKSAAQLVNLAIAALGEEFKQYNNSTSLPVYARPITAITWVRATTHTGKRVALDVYAQGSLWTCTHSEIAKALLEQNGIVQDIDPYVNCHEVILGAENS